MKITEYIESRDHYLILNEDAFMKNPITREWEHCIIYQQFEKYDEETNSWKLILDENDNNNSRMTFVRESTDFWNKFRYIKEKENLDD